MDIAVYSIQIIQVAVIVALIFITVCQWIYRRDYLYPGILHSSLWLIVLLSYAFFSAHFIQLSVETYLIVVSGTITFSLGAYLATLGYVPSKRPIELKGAGEHTLPFKILALLPMLALPFYIMRANSIGMLGPYTSIMMNIRTSLSDAGAPDFGIWSYFATLGIVSAGMHILVWKGISKVRLILVIGTALAYAFYSTGRTNLTLLLILLVSIFLITRNLRVSRGIVYLISSGITIFIVGCIIYHKGYDPSEGLRQNIENISYNFMDYAVSPLCAFDIFIHKSRVPEYGANMSRTVFALLSRIGFDTHPIGLIQSYAWVPFPTNVYTVFQPYYADFLLYGALTIQFFLGFWHGFLYKKAGSGSFVYCFLYSIFLYPLFMQFFQDQYFNLLSTWLQCFLVMAFYSLSMSLNRKIVRNSFDPSRCAIRLLTKQGLQFADGPRDTGTEIGNI